MSLDRPALWLVERAKGLLDETIPADRLREFLARALAQCERMLASGRLIMPPAFTHELSRAGALASQIGLLPGPDRAIESRTPIPLSDAEAWLAQIPNGKIMGRGGLLAGAGGALQTVLESPESPSGPALDGALEALLRHIETRRRDGLRLSQTPEEADSWMEWLSVAALLSRASRRRGDLRLLNAALKLNDWAYPAHRGLPPGPRLTRYLLSIAEAEAAAMEGLA